MMWLEVIHVRAADRERKRLPAILVQLIDEVREKKSCRKVKLFRRALLNTDVCLHLYHDSENLQDTGSPIGVHLAAALKPFGMVNHTVWKASDQTEL